MSVETPAAPTTGIGAAHTDPDAVEAYGMQREICARAGTDADGNLRDAPLDPVSAAYRLTGPLSVPLLQRAIELVTAELDVLSARLRAVDGRFLLVREAGLPGVPVVTVDLRGATADRQRFRLAHIARHSAGMLRDMRHGPAGVLTIAVLDDVDRVLFADFDHGLVDQYGLHALLRRVAQVYGHLAARDEEAASRAARPDSGFLPFAREAQADSAGRAAADAFWRPLVRHSRYEVAMPGRAWRPWQERRSTEHLWWRMPDADVEAMSAARASTGASRVSLFLAALSVVLYGVTGGDFVPITYHRHGHAGSVPPIGPLWDTFITFAPPDADERLARWAASFAEANTDAPSMRGLALVDFASLDRVMELRRFTVNVRLPERPLRFGAVRAVAADFSDVPASAPVPRPPKNNIGIRLYPLGSGRIATSLNYGPDDYAAGERIFVATSHVVRELVTRPDMRLGAVGAAATRILRGEEA